MRDVTLRDVKLLEDIGLERMRNAKVSPPCIDRIQEKIGRLKIRIVKMLGVSSEDCSIVLGDHREVPDWVDRYLDTEISPQLRRSFHSIKGEVQRCLKIGQSR